MKTAPILLLATIYFSACTEKTGNRKIKLPDNANCSYFRNELNPTGKPILVVEDELFISRANTDTNQVKMGVKNELIKGYLGCVRVDTVLGVFFDFRVFSDIAFNEYGLIRKNNTITFILQSGKSVVISFGATVSGSTNLSAGYTQYKTFSRITRGDAALLKGSELKRVVIAWTKREDEYKVVNPKVFMSQIPCVE